MPRNFPVKLTKCENWSCDVTYNNREKSCNVVKQLPLFLRLCYPEKRNKVILWLEYEFKFSIIHTDENEGDLDIDSKALMTAASLLGETPFSSTTKASEVKYMIVCLNIFSVEDKSCYIFQQQWIQIIQCYIFSILYIQTGSYVICVVNMFYFLQIILHLFPHFSNNIQ